MIQVETIRIALAVMAFMIMIDSLETLTQKWTIGGRAIRFRWNGWYVARLLCFGSILAFMAVSTSPLTDPRDVLVLSVTLAVSGSTIIRFRFGQDGADTQGLIVIALGLLSFLVAPSHRYQWFSGAVLLVLIADYLCAGIAKIRSTDWREGRALGMIITTPYFKPSIDLPSWLRRSIISKPAHELLISLQLVTPVMLVLPPQYRLVLLIPLALFHIGNGVVIGLNDFTGVFVPSLAIAGTSNLDLLLRHL